MKKVNIENDKFEFFDLTLNITFWGDGMLKDKQNKTVKFFYNCSFSF